MSDFHIERTVKPRKAHTCEWCGETIPRGEPCTIGSGRFDEHFYEWYMHSECHKAAKQPGATDPDYGLPEPGSMLRGFNATRDEACDECERRPFVGWSEDEQRALCEECGAVQPFRKAAA